MSAFNPMDFNPTVTDAGSTEFPVIPEGEYVASVEALGKDGVIWRTTDKGQLILDVTWNIDDEEVKQAMNKTKVTARQSIFIDLTESGSFDMSKGKNRQLWLLRDALGQNVAGQPWDVTKMIGGLAKIKIKHRIVDDGTIYADVKGTSAA